MKNRNPVAVVLLTLVTLGIYGIYWAVQTKEEMNQRGAEIPTAWWIIVPLANIWWGWKYCEGVEKVTKGKLQAPVAFLLFLAVDFIGMAVVQYYYNTQTSPAKA